MPSRRRISTAATVIGRAVIGIAAQPSAANADAARVVPKRLDFRCGRLIGGVAGAGIVATSLAFGSPAATADIEVNCGYGAPLIDTPFGGYCDNPPEPTGQHWHCEWGFGFASCSWRWGDNTPAPAPDHA